MELYLSRFASDDKKTVGRLFVDGRFECFTLEDPVRALGPEGQGKIPGRTAIPAGRYEVVAQDSPRYGKGTLTLKDVPHFSYIRIHAGNTHKDTDGCLLVGETWKESNPDFIGHSRDALRHLKAVVTFPCWITIADAK